MTVNFKDSDSPEERAVKLNQIEQMAKITRIETHIGLDQAPTQVVRPLTAEEAWQKSKDPKESAWMQMMCFFYAHHKHMNSGQTINKFGECGVFDNTDIIVIIRNQGYEASTWRGRLKERLVRWKLIEEF